MAEPKAEPKPEPSRPKALGETLEDVEAFAARLAPGAPLIGIDAGTKTLGLALSDVTRTIAFLVSPLCSNLTGEAVQVDGGFSKSYF